MIRAAILTALLLLSGPAFAQEAPSTSVVRLNSGQAILDGVALNASAANRTFTVVLGNDDARWSKLLLKIVLDRTAATTLDIAPTFSFDCSVYGAVQTGAVSSGTRTLSNLADTKAVSGDVTPIIEYDVRGYRCARFVLSGTSAGASDLVDVYATAVVGF